MKTTQFNQSHATVATFQAPFIWNNNPGGNFTIFYSYACPEIVIFPSGATYRFTFEGSRKAGEQTGSRTTTKQCNKWLGEDYKKLPTFSLKEFEAQLFDTRLDRYF